MSIAAVVAVYGWTVLSEPGRTWLGGGSELGSLWPLLVLAAVFLAAGAAGTTLVYLRRDRTTVPRLIGGWILGTVSLAAVAVAVVALIAAIQARGTA